MRKMVLGALLSAGAAALFLGSGLSAMVARDTGEEIRVFVLDKGGNAVDVGNWTGAIDVTPANGSRKAFRLEPRTPGQKEGSKDPKAGAPEKFGGAKGEGQERAKGADAKKMAPKDLMLCGQVKKLDDWWVEMVVVRKGEGTSGAGFMHDHHGPYFKAAVDEASLKDSKAGVVNFKATLVFTMPNGDTKYVKGFEYPEGLTEDVLGRLIDKEFKETSKMDHEQAVALSRKIEPTLQALPPLSFKSDGDRQEFDKAKQDCLASCRQLEQATGKDIGEAADKCKSALKEVRSQAKDAQGVLTAD
jgi:hypothetical protein